MRAGIRRIIYLLLSVAICVWIYGKSQQRRVAHFGLGYKSDSARISALEAELKSLNAQLGFEQKDFQFDLPRNQKLIARFEAELNGKPCPGATFGFVIPAPDKPKGEDEQGSLSVRFRQPKFQTNQPTNPSWEVVACTPGGFSCLRYHLTPPIDVFASDTTSGEGASGGEIREGVDSKVWEWRRTTNNTKGESECDFKWRLIVRVEKKSPGEETREVRLIDKPLAK